MMPIPLVEYSGSDDYIGTDSYITYRVQAHSEFQRDTKIAGSFSHQAPAGQCYFSVLVNVRRPPARYHDLSPRAMDGFHGEIS